MLLAGETTILAEVTGSGGLARTGGLHAGGRGGDGGVEGGGVGSVLLTCTGGCGGFSSIAPSPQAGPNRPKTNAEETGGEIRRTDGAQLTELPPPRARCSASLLSSRVGACLLGTMGELRSIGGAQ